MFQVAFLELCQQTGEEGARTNQSQILKLYNRFVRVHLALIVFELLRCY
jgi:hypothetical protein